MNEGLRDRIAGSFYGLLVGDALGVPVEDCSADEIRRSVGSGWRIIPGFRRSWPAGLHSDDGQQAILGCDAVLAAPDEPGEAFAWLVKGLYEAHPAGTPRGLFPCGLHRGHGSNFRITMKKLGKQLGEGLPWDGAATHTAGNGAAMRIGPLALFHRDCPERLAEAVVHLSRTTHADVAGIAAAGAVAFAVARCLTWDGSAMDLADHSLVELVRSVEQIAQQALPDAQDGALFSEALARMPLLACSSRTVALKEIEELANRTSSRPCRATSGYALASVMTALYMFFSSRSFGRAVQETVDLGGDTDTTAAMVGQMAGALYGARSIPAEWLHSLVAFGALEDRIDAFLRKQAPFVPGVSAVALELGWTAELFA